MKKREVLNLQGGQCYVLLPPQEEMGEVILSAVVLPKGGMHQCRKVSQVPMDLDVQYWEVMIISSGGSCYHAPFPPPPEH